MPERVDWEMLKSGKRTSLAVAFLMVDGFMCPLSVGAEKTHSEGATGRRISRIAATRFGSGNDRRAFAVLPKGIGSAPSQ